MEETKKVIRKPRVKKQVLEQKVDNLVITTSVEQVVEPVKSIEKKTRKPRTKKTYSEETKEIQAPPMEGDKQAQKVIIGLDPGFKQLGVGIIDFETGAYIDSFVTAVRSDAKLTQSQVDGQIANNVQKLIDDLFKKYDVELVVIELQLGNFSCDRVQLCLVAALPQDVKFVVQHSKLKLKHDEVKDVLASNPDSGKYHQNKNVGKQLAQKLFSGLPDSISFDQCDSLCHAYYVFKNKQKIEFVQKSKL